MKTTTRFGRGIWQASPVALAVAAALGAATPVYAADKAAADDLQEIVVTARFREENLQSTPLAITALNADALEERSFKNLDDIGAAIPNAYFRQPVSNYGPTQTVGLRGMIQVDFNYAFEPAVGVYIDDVYHGSLTGSSMDLMDLERVEVLRGPQGTLFGKNSMGGAIRMISKKPQGDGKGYVEATYGARNRVDVKAVGDFTLVDDTLFARVSGVSRRQDGYGKNLDFTCEMIRRGTPTLAGIGDGLGAPTTVGGLPTPVTAGSAADNAFAVPMTIDPRQGSGCALGSLGGSESQAVRAMLRFLPTSDLEFNLSADYSAQLSEPPVETLLTDRGDTDGRVAATTYAPLAIPTAGYPLTIYKKYGINYQTQKRFVTGNPYTNYSTYGDITSGVSYDRFTHLKAWGLSASMDYNVAEKTHLKVLGSYRTYNTTWVNDSDEMPFELTQTNYLQQHEQSQLEAQLTGSLLDDKLQWTSGLFYYKSNSRAYNTANFVTFGLQFVADDTFSSENKSAFVHLNYKFTDKLSLSGGLRYTDEAKVNNFRHYGLVVLPAPLNYGGSRPDYKIGLDYQATDSLFLYGQVSTGFTSAGVTPRVFTIGQVQGLPGEEVVNYELGAKVEFFDKKLRVNSAVFYMDWKSRLVNRTASQCTLSSNPSAGTPYFLNGATCPVGTERAGLAGTSWFLYLNEPGKTKGFETEISAFPIQGLMLNASLGYLSFEGDAAPGTISYRDSSAVIQPKWNGSAGIQYQVAFSGGAKLTPRLDYFYQGERTNGNPALVQRDPQDINPAYGIFNARLAYEPASGDWQVALSANNLFDKFYWNQLGSATIRGGALDGNPTYARVGTPSRPREWALTVKKSF